MADNQVDLKLNLDFKGVNDALYQMIGEFNGTDKEFQRIADNIQKNAKKLEASILVFGPASKQAANAQKALQANMVSLVANGVNPQIAAIATLSQNYNSLNGILATTQSSTNGATSAINNNANSLKQSNKQWSALALVVQDLPYGFRGIQNNLPALFGSLATGAGAAYFAFSAVVAVITALDMGIIKFGKSVKLTTDYSKDAATTFANETIKLESLYTVSTNVNASMEDRLQAAKTLKTEYPDLLALYSEEQITLGEAEIAYRLLTDTIWKYAQAKAAEKSLEELAVKQNELNVKRVKAQADQKERDIKGLKTVNYLMYNNLTIGEQFNKFINDLPQNGAFGPMVNSLLAMKKSSDVLYDIEQQQTAINDEVSIYKGIVNENINAEDKLAQFKANEFKKEQERQKKLALKNNKEAKPTVSRFDENLAQEQFNFYKDSIFRAEEYFTKLNNIQKVNALMEATIKGASLDELFTIQQTYEQKELNFRKTIEDKKFAIRQQSEERQKQLTKSYDDQKIKDQVTYTTNYIATLDAQLKAEMRLNRNNVALQQEDIKNKLIQLQFAQVFAAGNVKALDAINAAILKLKGNLTGLGDVTTTVNNILTTGLQDAFVGIGESLGELVTTGKFSFGILGNILADALIGIGKALILYSSLVQAAKKAIEAGQVKAGLIIGIAAVAAGFALKGQMNKKRDTGGPKAFANGGIISGPTMGLMGEYPGASHNPEVVAPLDKLKSLIGSSGGGTLEARISGNDLLILMNKAGRTNNNTF
jgi:hypothetical protein